MPIAKPAPTRVDPSSQRLGRACAHFLDDLRLALALRDLIETRDDPEGLPDTLRQKIAATQK